MRRPPGILAPGYCLCGPLFCSNQQARGEIYRNRVIVAPGWSGVRAGRWGRWEGSCRGASSRVADVTLGARLFPELGDSVEALQNE